MWDPCNLTGMGYSSWIPPDPAAGAIPEAVRIPDPAPDMMMSRQPMKCSWSYLPHVTNAHADFTADFPADFRCGLSLWTFTVDFACGLCLWTLPVDFACGLLPADFPCHPTFDLVPK